MSVYVIVSYDVVDPGRYQGYIPGVVPLLQKHGAEILAADNEVKALEGEARGMTVLLRFPSEEAVRAWHGDPEYAPVRQIRLDSTSNGSIVMLREFVPPTS